MVEITLPIILQILQTAGILVGIVYYITIMRNSQRSQQMQLETREAQLMMQLWQSYMELREQSYFWRLELEYEDFDDFWDRYGYDPSFWMKYGPIIGWYENLGVLVKEGLFDMRLIALSYAGATRQLWEKLEPLMDGLKEKHNYPRLYSETEWLCKELMKYMDEHPELKT